MARVQEERRRIPLDTKTCRELALGVGDARVLPAPLAVEALRAARRVLRVDADHLYVRVRAREPSQVGGLRVAAGAPRSPDVEDERRASVGGEVDAPARDGVGAGELDRPLRPVGDAADARGPVVAGGEVAADERGHDDNQQRGNGRPAQSRTAAARTPAGSPCLLPFPLCLPLAHRQVPSGRPARSLPADPFDDLVCERRQSVLARAERAQLLDRPGERVEQ